MTTKEEQRRIEDDEEEAAEREREKKKCGGKVKGRAAGGRLDKRNRGGGKWIAGAIKHPGALHRELGVPQGEKIPAKKLEKAAHSDNPTERRRANLAKTLKGFHH